MSCIFQDCKNTRTNCKSLDIHFFKIPLLPFIRKKWLNSCRKEENYLKKESFVCSIHFAQEDLRMNKNKVRLNRNAIPFQNSTLNECFGSHVEEYLDEYIQECDEYLNGYETPTGGISRKIIRKLRTTVSTQTDFSFEENQKLIDNEIVELKNKIASLELQLNSFKEKKSLFGKISEQNICSQARYSFKDISFATSLYSAGPRSYKFLRKNDFPLPSLTTLRRWAAKLCVDQGLQINLLAHMRTFDLALEEKLCILSFDEMKCREEWAYDRKQDQIIAPKRMVQVAMVRGIRGNWKQPIFYDFNCKMTKQIIFNIIEQLYQIGYTVVAAVSDLGPENQQLWNSMEISYKKPYFTHPSDNSKLIFVFADVPHLIKLLRNHFLDDGFFFKGSFLQRKVIEELFALCNFDLSITKSLGIEMLNVKGAARQKVKLATKLFSHTVASALKRTTQLGLCRNPIEFLRCSELFQIINDWFDIFNIKTPAKDSRALSKAYGMSLVVQNEALEMMSKTVKELYAFKVGGKMLPFQRGILQNNNALPLLMNSLKETYSMKFILTNKLNQDCLENFFSAIRAKGGLHDHPSPLEFKYRFRSYILGRNENILCAESNVEATQEKTIEFDSFSEDIILSSEIFGSINKIPISEEEHFEALECQDTQNLWGDLNQLNDIEYDGLENFAGYLISRMGLKDFGSKTAENQDKTYSYVNLLSEGGLMKPNEVFMKYMEVLNTIFLKFNGGQLSTKENYMKNLINMYDLKIDQNIVKRFFLGRTFFRIRKLNHGCKNHLHVYKKVKKTIS